MCLNGMGAAMLDRDGFETWIRTSDRGDTVVYYVGDLPADRRADKSVEQLAETVFRHSEGAWWHMSPCQHARGVEFGTGDVLLTKIRRADDTPGFCYLAERQ